MSKKSLESIEEKHPANARTDIPPTEGYSMEVDGKLKAQFSTPESAFEAGTELKMKFPFIQVRIYDARTRTRTPVELPET
jgi:hypothetical protein